MSKILLLALISLFILSGCSKDMNGDKDVLTESEVKEIVLQEVENGKIAHLEFGQDEVNPSFEVIVLDDNYEYDIKVDAVTGEILEKEKEEIKSSDKSSSVVDENEEDTTQDVSLSEEKAKSIALSKVKEGARVTEIKYEKENNVPVYEVTLIDEEYEYSIEIDATNGSIISEEKEQLNK